jgi:NAD(P)-dependent dehydrogenase (short-subunit alcohol dehydrogenase family)
MKLGLAGRTVLVTGGSSGIGAALATAYGREGANVVVTYRSDASGAAATAEAVEQAGGQALTATFDLADPASAEAVVATALARYGHLDVLVANAVVWPQRSPTGRIEDLPPDAWTSGLRANVEGTFALAQAALPHLRASNQGRILFISTGLAEEGMPGAAIYTTAKSAIHGLARSLAWEGGGDGVLVNTIAAGLTLTDRNRSRLPGAMRDATASRTPLGRLSTPEDLVAPVLFLTSAANSSITGEVLREGSSTGRSSHAA